jgi:UDP-glucose 4-epimerase
VRDVFSSKAVVKIIGTRHGEKLYESLLSREEMARAQDLDEYYRVPADDRDLNYNKYFIEGETKVSAVEDYTSHNTVRLDVDKVKALLMKLDFIQDELDA